MTPLIAVPVKSNYSVSLCCHGCLFYNDLESTNSCAAKSWRLSVFSRLHFFFHFSCTAGKYFTLHDALKNLLPEFFAGKSLINDKPCIEESEDSQKVSSEDVGSSTGAGEGKEIVSQPMESCCNDAEIKLIRIQGIEPKLEIPFSWVVNNLKNPEHFLHICVCVKIPNVNAA